MADQPILVYSRPHRGFKYHRRILLPHAGRASAAALCEFEPSLWSSDKGNPNPPSKSSRLCDRCEAEAIKIQGGING